MTKHEYRVRYQRRPWASLQSRIFQSEPPARRLVDKLGRRRRRRDLAPVVELHLQRRTVGVWEDVPLIDVDPTVTPDRMPAADAQETGRVEHEAHCPLGQKMTEAALAGCVPTLVFNAARRCDR
jgi:hypothetical protein